MKIFLKKSQVVSEEKKWKLQKAVQTSHKLIKEKLWELPHHATSALSRKTSLCIGMLLCYEIMMANWTFALPKDKKGQFAGLAILCWASWKISTWHTFLFHLKNPPHTVKFDGLPENVVSYCQNVSNHWMYYEIRSNQDGEAWAMLCASKISPWQIMHHKARHDNTTLWICNTLTVISHIILACSRCASAKGTLIMQLLQTKQNDHWRMFQDG